MKGFEGFGIEEYASYIRRSFARKIFFIGFAVGALMISIWLAPFNTWIKAIVILAIALLLAFLEDKIDLSKLGR